MRREEKLLTITAVIAACLCWQVMSFATPPGTGAELVPDAKPAAAQSQDTMFSSTRHGDPSARPAPAAGVEFPGLRPWTTAKRPPIGKEPGAYSGAVGPPARSGEQGERGGPRQNCQHRVDLWGCFGEGWGYGSSSLDVFVNGNPVLTGITLGGGYGPASYYFPAANGNTIATVFHDGGYFPEDAYYFIYDGNGLLLGQDGIVGEDCFQYPTGITVTANCEEGEPGACCFGDGHCESLRPGACYTAGGIYQGAGTGCDPNPCPQPPPNDLCENAQLVAGPFPQTVSGTTIDATVDCPLVLGWNAVWYEVVLPYAVNYVSVRYCGTSEGDFGGGLIYYDACDDCPNYHNAGGWGYSFNSCSVGGSRGVDMWWNNLPGPRSIWIPAYFTPAITFVATFNVQEVVTPCDVVCVGAPEGEPVCQDNYEDLTNSGCNRVPNRFSPIACNTTVCGTSGTFRYSYSLDSRRDTDWYRIDTLVPTAFTWSVTAEFPVLIVAMRAGSEPTPCAGYAILETANAGPCNPATIDTGPQPAGTYWFWVGPSEFGPTCGVEYAATLTTVPCVPPCATCPGDVSGDGDVDGEDVQGVVDCLLGGEINCGCADMDGGGVGMSDIGPFVNALLNGECPPPPPTGACCQPWGACTLTREGDCAPPGIWQGPGTDCAPNLCPPPPCVDMTLTAPGSVSGNTCGAGNDCQLRGSAEQIVQVTIPSDGQWTFSLCSSSPPWDSYLLLTRTCCGQILWWNDDTYSYGCTGGLSWLSYPLTAGTYYVAIEGRLDTSCGAWTLNVSGPP